MSIYAEAGVSLMDSELTRGELYLHLLPLFTTDRIEIPDDPRLRAELLGLERRTGRSGKDAVDHCPGRHDDLANAVARAAWSAARSGAVPDPAVLIPSRMFDDITNRRLDEGNYDLPLWRSRH